MLGVAAVVETIARRGRRAPSALYVLVLCLLALATTLPLALPRPAAAAVVVPRRACCRSRPFDDADRRRAGRTAVVGLPARPRVVTAGCGRRCGLPLPGAGPRSVRGPESTGLAVLLAALLPVAVAGGIGAAGAPGRGRSSSGAAQEAVAGTLLEHTARGERARIARELHDVVAHHISMIAVQAETARLTTPGMPAAGAQRLSAIGDTARAALTEMRRLLGVLREDADADAADRQPQPGLRQLNELLDEARDASGAGDPADLSGRRSPLDPGVELAAYRIVQEALTNARRHAPGRRRRRRTAATPTTALLRAGSGTTARARRRRRCDACRARAARACGNGPPPSAVELRDRRRGRRRIPRRAILPATAGAAG